MHYVYVLADNTFRQARPVRKNDFRMFNTSNSNKPRHHLSPQLKIAALRHLASSNFYLLIFSDEILSIVDVETFSDEYVTLPVLQSLLNSNVVTDHVFNSRDENENIIYRANQWANYAILILQGRALVETSAEHLVFEAGPFMLFGETVLKDVNEIYPEVSSLKDPELQSAQLAAKARFLPDYTVRAITNIQFLRITAEHYLLARRLSAWITKLHPQVVLYSGLRMSPFGLRYIRGMAVFRTGYRIICSKTKTPDLPDPGLECDPPEMPAKSEINMSISAAFVMLKQ
ncbi:unnamed protein product [Schistocephalus solidus]|uniref:Cyclic nucleotide-binding domain-containing protein n=1 Tax=Schistocephalus solidus TaxID=70667 RepID=A0A183SK94_SCHSO|nr:unnamed protein product [Schistocephalus solidus]